MMMDSEEEEEQTALVCDNGKETEIRDFQLYGQKNVKFRCIFNGHLTFCKNFASDC